LRADARPFDVIVIGGGSFGAAFAQHVFSRFRLRSPVKQHHHKKEPAQQALSQWS
jgi:glycerol-3-phosphate dehydrogenase